ncbi:MAG TPA: tagaturonate epimerase family protein, partial [Rhodothermales bacterium]
FPWTRPVTLGLKPSVGCGDRLGLATPGHVRAVRDHRLVPIFPQQSIREMTRTGREPIDVMDDAVWGVFEEGWRNGFGADADHLKTFEDVDRTVEAGFTFFTIDPSAYVDNDADADDASTLRAKAERLPWDELRTQFDDYRRSYVGISHRIGDEEASFDDESFLRAIVKYSAAVAHTARMHRHLQEQMAGRPFELEMSVDETETPTSILEHYFVASELRRLGVAVVSLAPRFVGRLEKGVDYIGDLTEFERSLVQHVAIARQMGPYKLSLHSGSDKFSLYPIFARLAGNLFHLKTAGTSYLEALRAIARIDAGLFRKILGFAIERYETDKATYHVSAELSNVPSPASLSDAQLPDLLDDFDSRQVLHVTFGSVLTRDEFSGPIRAALIRDEEVHYEAVKRYFDRHLAPFDGLAG